MNGTAFFPCTICESQCGRHVLQRNELWKQQLLRSVPCLPGPHRQLYREHRLHLQQLLLWARQRLRLRLRLRLLPSWCQYRKRGRDYGAGCGRNVYRGGCRCCAESRECRGLCVQYYGGYGRHVILCDAPPPWVHLALVRWTKREDKRQPEKSDR